MQSVVLLFGSNDAEASALVSRAVTECEATVGELVCLSEEYLSEAYGFTAERHFVNRAAEFYTERDAYSLLDEINRIEARMGRDRNEERRVQALTGEQYASRPIDIDIIFYGDSTFNDTRLTIPYHFLYERLYALRPVAEVAPDRQHPALKLTPAEALRRAEAGEAEEVAEIGEVVEAEQKENK